MRNFIAAVLILVSIAVFVVVRIPAVTQLRSYPVSMLEQEANAMQMKLDAATTIGSRAEVEKNQIRREKMYYRIEILRRTFGLEWLAACMGLFGIGLFALNFINKVESTKKITRVRVHELMPTEVYVDEQDFYRRTQDSFPSRDEAMQWYETDPLRICSYCGANTVKPSKGQKGDELQLITFYKKVPQGAKDLRIVYGSSWFVYPAAELQCENCNQKVLR